MRRAIVGMETSGAVRDALQAAGFWTVSVDLLPHQSGGLHVEADLFDYLAADATFDTGAFHPNCTNHTNAVAWAFKDPDFDRYPGVGYHQKLKPGTLFGAERRVARARDEEDVRRIRDLPFLKVIENPAGSLSRVHNLGPAHDVVQPYNFGADASKTTWLWCFDKDGEAVPGFCLPRDPALFVKPRLFCPTCRQCSPYEAGGSGCVHCGEEAGLLRPRWANQTDSGQNRESPGELRWQVRSDTYPGIASALATTLARLTGASQSGM